MNRMLTALIGSALLFAPYRVEAHGGDAAAPNLVGSWILKVAPQPNPALPVTPPPFTASFNFELGGTAAETDASFNQGPPLVLTPESGAVSASDGWGTWRALGHGRYRSRFLKYLFSSEGTHIGYVDTRLEITLDGPKRFHGRGNSAFILSTDLDTPPAITDGITLFSGERFELDDE